MTQVTRWKGQRRVIVRRKTWPRYRLWRHEQAFDRRWAELERQFAVLNERTRRIEEARE